MSQSKLSKPSNNNKGNSKPSNKNQNSNKSDKRKEVVNKQNSQSTKDSRKDNMSNRSTENSNMANKPQWYYGDNVLADEISRFSFNQFVGQTARQLGYGYGETYGDYLPLPTVMVIPVNPCPGVTMIREKPDVVGEYELNPHLGRGINLALQQWWTILTAKSGRNAGYTKNDVGALLLELGEIISTQEHLRRFFGITWAYTLRNRELPKYLLEDMGLDADDFFAHLADYRLKFNTTIVKLNKLPIPSNINYFEKCQDLYQQVYADSTSSMAQYYVLVPASTWTLEEDGSEKGTVLKTTSMFYDVNDTDGGKTYKRRKKTFQEYLDILNLMIDKIMLSSTFSIIYSDMINAAATGNLSLWSFDLVTEDYGKEGIFAYNEYFLLMVHNAMFTGQQYTEPWDRSTPTSGPMNRYVNWELKDFTYANDVILSVEQDALIYNPRFLAKSDEFKYYTEPLVCDSISDNPNPEDRIEMNVYKIGNLSTTPYYEYDPANNGYANLDLPDHYCIEALIYGDRHTILQEINNYAIQQCDPEDGETATRADAAYCMTKFDWCPITFGQSRPDITQTFVEASTPYGDLNMWTTLTNDWFMRVNDAKFFGLFQIQ